MEVRQWELWWQHTTSVVSTSCCMACKTSLWVELPSRTTFGITTQSDENFTNTTVLIWQLYCQRLHWCGELLASDQRQHSLDNSHCCYSLPTPVRTLVLSCGQPAAKCQRHEHITGRHFPVRLSKRNMKQRRWDSYLWCSECGKPPCVMVQDPPEDGHSCFERCHIECLWTQLLQQTVIIIVAVYDITLLNAT